MDKQWVPTERMHWEKHSIISDSSTWKVYLELHLGEMFRETQWRDVLQNNWPVLSKNVQTNAVCDHNWIHTCKPITGKMGEMQKKSVD